MPPTSCRVVSYWEQKDHPRFVGTSRHLTQGAIFTDNVRWNADELTLRGESEVVGGHPCEVRIHMPEGFEPVEPDLRSEQAVTKLMLRSDNSENVEWQMKFSKD
ncbi:MAG: hypothetical protein KGZ25_08035 [Planctomycetes bacterium]|nr:hypothetical protein [Planctomycetota bacterium]